ncbi:MAG: sensor histidine kinase, partial [Thermodesulfobacteriota bacterium]
MARARRTSLRTEIIISTALLVGAALLFITMLLIRLGENDRLAEQVKSCLSQSRTLVHALALVNPLQHESLLHEAAQEYNAQTAFVVDSDLEASAGYRSEAHLENTQIRQLLRRALLQNEAVVQIHHPASWLEFSGAENPRFEVALGFQGQSGKQALYLCFPLGQVRSRTLEQLRLALWISLGYGMVLIGAAVHILRRAVITPVESLTEVTEALIHGRKDARVEPAGPREIAALGQSFNRMAATLEQNQAQQQFQVEKLQDKNRELSAARLSLMQAERMASVGHLASGMAHEIGNPLSAVLAYLNLARHKDDATQRDDLLRRAETEAARIDHIIRDMLDYATSGTSSGSETGQRCIECDPATVIEQTVEMLRYQGVFKQRQIKANLPQSLPSCFVPPNHLQQILVNLILNARDATGAGGLI